MDDESILAGLDGDPDAFALGGGGDERAVSGRPGAASPAGQRQAHLLPMLPLRLCEPPSREALAVGGLAEDIALLRRRRRDSDAISFDPARLPIADFDARATRRAAPPSSGLHVVPSAHVAVDGRCRSDNGPGACLVAGQREFRCFTDAEVRGGRAVARTATGTLFGLVPDGVDHVTVHDVGARFVARGLRQRLTRRKWARSRAADHAELRSVGRRAFASRGAAVGLNARRPKMKEDRWVTA